MADTKQIDKYIIGLNNYGLYPTLKLLKMYEEAENYEECLTIFLAVKAKIKYEIVVYRNNNGKLFNEEDFPTHIDQFNDEKYRKMFDIFGLKAYVTVEDPYKYIEAIKRL